MATAVSERRCGDKKELLSKLSSMETRYVSHSLCVYVCVCVCCVQSGVSGEGGKGTLV